ncbi:TonB-dependent receptor [Helicobacter aurati]|uniref:TonB-dependent receptor n=1 Tax=Helicobacter aurati TaxID=137778 RepID=A0A3D8J7A5_9HELI|nr:TonB-dependent receptor [Helicobacter aurati]RDU73383.1 TonB-dependent receptor [Helicobacter aurati]
MLDVKLKKYLYPLKIWNIGNEIKNMIPNVNAVCCAAVMGSFSYADNLQTKTLSASSINNIALHKKQSDLLIAKADLDSAMSNKRNNEQQSEDIAHARADKVIAVSAMQTTFDDLNRNVYAVSREQIQNKGYRSAEDIFRYMPFVGLANVGLGSNLDLRGQGNRANTSVQVMVNGIYTNMLDSSHGVSPINTFSPTIIESIDILPGGGAVMYGNGTRGGVVNITTQRRYDKPFFSAGMNYSNIIASIGNNVNADAKFGTKVGEHTHLSLGAAYILRGGSRDGDITQGAQANFGIIHDFTQRSSLAFGIDYFYGDIKTSPNNSFQITPNPTKSDRKTKGLGNYHNRQQRLDVNVSYESTFAENHKLNVTTFYHLNRLTYLDSKGVIASYMGLNNVAYDQSGSLFDDQKLGLIAKYDWKHLNGRLIAGYESLYQLGKRTLEQLIYGRGMVGQIPNFVYNHPLYVSLQGNKWSNALFAIEKYDFTSNFSLTTGGRYENSFYDIDVTNRQTISVANNIASRVNEQRQYTTFVNNFAFELTSNYKYLDSGNVYAKYEKGFFSPSPNNLLTRQSNVNNGAYYPTNLKQENYHTFEIGLKDFFADMISFSAAIFYTLTQNEFYTIGNAHSIGGVVYGNYDLTGRAGIELFSEQFFFNDMLRLSESFTYIDARVLKNNGVHSNLMIPYVANYKATFTIHYQPLKSLGIWIQNSFIGTQKDVESFTTTGRPNVVTRSEGQKTIPSYILTDIGIHYSFDARHKFSMSAGVRNLFDVFYYSYFNGNASDPIAGYGYLIGQGRSLFVEGRVVFD